MPNWKNWVQGWAMEPRDVSLQTRYQNITKCPWTKNTKYTEIITGDVDSQLIYKYYHKYIQNSSCSTSRCLTTELYLIFGAYRNSCENINILSSIFFFMFYCLPLINVNVFILIHCICEGCHFLNVIFLYIFFISTCMWNIHISTEITFIAK
jgi:hypothetical protein